MQLACDPESSATIWCKRSHSWQAIKSACIFKISPILRRWNIPRQGNLNDPICYLISDMTKSLIFFRAWFTKPTGMPPGAGGLNLIPVSSGVKTTITLLRSWKRVVNLYCWMKKGDHLPAIGGITVKSALGRLPTVIASSATNYNCLGSTFFWN